MRSGIEECQWAWCRKYVGRIWGLLLSHIFGWSEVYLRKFEVQQANPKTLIAAARHLVSFVGPECFAVWKPIRIQIHIDHILLDFQLKPGSTTPKVLAHESPFNSPSPAKPPDKLAFALRHFKQPRRIHFMFKSFELWVVLPWQGQDLWNIAWATKPSAMVVTGGETSKVAASIVRSSLRYTFSLRYKNGWVGSAWFVDFGSFIPTNFKGILYKLASVSWFILLIASFDFSRCKSRRFVSGSSRRLVSRSPAVILAW